MNNLLKVVPLLLVMCIVSGCSTLANINTDTIGKIKLGADIVLLDREFEPAHEAVMTNDFNGSERQAIEFHLAKLQSLKTLADNLVQLENGEDLANSIIATADTRAFLDAVETHYNASKAVYVSYLGRTSGTADPSLTAYDKTATSAWKSLSDIVDEGSGVKASELQDLLIYVARGYLLYRTGIKI